MHNKDKGLDIYLMGIGGTGMGAFAGLLKAAGHKVRGSDNAVYSPMKEKLADWGISYHSPYGASNLPLNPELVVVGNVIRRENPEAQLMRERELKHDSFPSALRSLFLKSATSLVAAGTHGKTTCSALLAHSLNHAGRDPGFLVGGIPLNFGESFRVSHLAHYPFVVEGDEYDTAYFDKKPKFLHYQPNFLLLTSIEFDHGDIYADLDAVIDAFAELLAGRSADDIAIVNAHDANIKTALARANSQASIMTYGDGGDFEALDTSFDQSGISFSVQLKKSTLGAIRIPLFGFHNAHNALGCYAMLHSYGLSHEEIALGFASFLGVKRRLEVRSCTKGAIKIDDFAHHPTAVRETIKAARQKYPQKKLWAIFEPRSATSCTARFQGDYVKALSGADRVILAPLGRTLAPDLMLNTNEMAHSLNGQGLHAEAHVGYESLQASIKTAGTGDVLLFMSNGDFQGHLPALLA